MVGHVEHAQARMHDGERAHESTRAFIRQDEIHNREVDGRPSSFGERRGIAWLFGNERLVAMTVEQRAHVVAHDILALDHEHGFHAAWGDAFDHDGLLDIVHARQVDGGVPVAGRIDRGNHRTAALAHDVIDRAEAKRRRREGIDVRVFDRKL